MNDQFVDEYDYIPANELEPGMLINYTVTIGAKRSAENFLILKRDDGLRVSFTENLEDDDSFACSYWAINSDGQKQSLTFLRNIETGHYANIRVFRGRK